MKVDEKNDIDTIVAQRHANVLVDKVGDLILRFQRSVVALKTKASSASGSPDFAELAKMGTSIIPNVMGVYAADKEGSWNLLLNQICKRKVPVGATNTEEYKKWETWYVSGADLAKLPV